MTTVGFVGGGMIGGTVAALGVAAGHQVVMSQEPGTSVHGAPYGPFGDEIGTPAGADKIRAALAQATR